MPPKTPKPITKGKTPTFKPPRPTSKSTKDATSRRKSEPTPRGRTTAIANDDEDDHDEKDDDDEIPSDTHQVPASEDESDASLPTHAAPSGASQDPPPTIPPALLTRLLHHHFKDSGTRIGKEANGVVGKYMETFVREAIARAAFERSEAAAKGGGSGMAGDFLEVSVIYSSGSGGSQMSKEIWLLTCRLWCRLRILRNWPRSCYWISERWKTRKKSASGYATWYCLSTREPPCSQRGDYLQWSFNGEDDGERMRQSFTPYGKS